MPPEVLHEQRVICLGNGEETSKIREVQTTFHILKFVEEHQHMGTNFAEPLLCGVVHVE